MKRQWFDEVECEVDDDDVVLKLKPINNDDLKPVSVVTVYRDTPEFVGLMLYNWSHIKYPREKLEWVIVDDSPTDSLKRYLPKDSNVRYVHTQPFRSLAEKRNHAVGLCEHDIIVHYDADDYYPGSSILARVRVLLEYPNKDYVFSWPIGVYNIYTEKSVAYGADYVLGRIPEGTMMYRKSHWKSHKFGEPTRGYEAESTNFISGNTSKGITINFMFSCIVFAHKKNATVHLTSEKAVESEHGCREIVDIGQTLSPEIIQILNNVKAFQE